MKQRAIVASLIGVFATSASAQDLAKFVDGELSGLVNTYQGIHAHPELSHHEAATAALLATELRTAGFTVTEHVGKYPDGTQAYGVVAILENGPGPRLLIRTDLDALPIVEETGLSYASHVTARNPAGQAVGVMHACGHDVHVTTMIGTARALASARAKWHGTVMLMLPSPADRQWRELPRLMSRSAALAVTARSRRKAKTRSSWRASSSCRCRPSSAGKRIRAIPRS